MPRALRPCRRLVLAALTAVIGFAAEPRAARACDVAILFAIDVSTSVNRREYALQTQGHAAAFRDPDVVSAILSKRGVSVAVMHWSGRNHQVMRTGWTRLESDASIAEFADQVAGIDRRIDFLETAIGAALVAGAQALRDPAASCRRQVIDVSGDGANNDGVEPDLVRGAIIARGVTINAVVIADPASEYRLVPDPIAFYRERVIGGPGAFLEVAEDFGDYARAFRRKLLRELQSSVAGLAPPDSGMPARFPHSVGFLIGAGPL